jgi:hypothetical protein
VKSGFKWALAAALAAAAPAARADEPAMSVTVNAQLMPVGTLGTDVTFGGSTLSNSPDAAVAFAFAAAFDYRFHPNFSVGIAPRYVLNVNAKDASADQASTELDFLLHLTALLEVIPGIEIFAQVSPGYSFLRFPPGAATDDPAGPVLDFAAGVHYALIPMLFVQAGLGYQLGSQSTKVSSLTLTMHPNYFHLELGAGIRF